MTVSTIACLTAYTNEAICFVPGLEILYMFRNSSPKKRRRRNCDTELFSKSDRCVSMLNMDYSRPYFSDEMESTIAYICVIE